MKPLTLFVGMLLLAAIIFFIFRSPAAKLIPVTIAPEPSAFTPRQVKTSGETEQWQLELEKTKKEVELFRRSYCQERPQWREVLTAKTIRNLYEDFGSEYNLDNATCVALAEIDLERKEYQLQANTECCGKLDKATAPEKIRDALRQHTIALAAEQQICDKKIALLLGERLNKDFIKWNERRLQTLMPAEMWEQRKKHMAIIKAPLKKGDTETANHRADIEQYIKARGF